MSYWQLNANYHAVLKFLLIYLDVYDLYCSYFTKFLQNFAWSWNLNANLSQTKLLL